MKFLLLFLFCASAFAQPLPRLKIDEISISGVSSGGFMAVQMGVAFSKTFQGVGSVAGGIYWCAEGKSERAQTTCMSRPEEIKAENQVAKARSLAEEGAIDSLSHIARQKIFLFTGSKDSVIYPANSEKLMEFYQGLGSVAPRLEKHVEAGHGFPTLDQGVECKLSMPPWINKCGFDLAAELLRTFHGNLKPRGAMIASHLRKFSQVEFGNAQTPLFAEGWIYVPKDCAAGSTCKLHVALHGCLMNPEFIGDKFVRMAGYNEWAESNRIVVLYPQSGKLGQANPYGCWDWFGFTGQNYVTKSGAQMNALKKMIEAIQAP